MGKHDLLTLEAAASALGVPVRSLRSAAEQHGYLVRMGRAIRIEAESLGELIQKCRDPQKAPAFTSSPIARTGISETQGDQINQRAASAAQMLKRRSQPTSPQKAAAIAPPPRTK